MEVYNMDVAGLVRRMRRFRYETVKATSSALPNTSEADFNRAKSYLNALSQYVDWIVGQPQLDLPEWAPHKIDLGVAAELAIPENEALMDLMTIYDAMEVEIGNSASARQATGLTPHDEKRCRDMVTKMEAFLDNYVAKIQPLDLPESTPLHDQTGPGRGGV